MCAWRISDVEWVGYSCSVVGMVHALAQAHAPLLGPIIARCTPMLGRRADADATSYAHFNVFRVPNTELILVVLLYLICMYTFSCVSHPIRRSLAHSRAMYTASLKMHQKPLKTEYAGCIVRGEYVFMNCSHRTACALIHL